MQLERPAARVRQLTRKSTLVPEHSTSETPSTLVPTRSPPSFPRLRHLTGTRTLAAWAGEAGGQDAAAGGWAAAHRQPRARAVQLQARRRGGRGVGSGARDGGARGAGPRPLPRQGSLPLRARHRRRHQDHQPGPRASESESESGVRRLAVRGRRAERETWGTLSGPADRLSTQLYNAQETQPVRCRSLSHPTRPALAWGVRLTPDACCAGSGRLSERG
eukprot:3042731-Rhodomonas_salina.1